MRTAKPKHFATEAELCAAFIAAIGKEWTAYAETAGWDILLVRNADGFQVGIQAKLKFNIDVINQALEDAGHWHIDGPHPDCRAVLVPQDEANRFDKICAYVGLTVIRMNGERRKKGRYWNSPAPFRPDLPKPADSWTERDWYEMATVQRHKLPEYVPDVAAGASSPLQLTHWKIKAIKIAVTLELRGHVTRRDFAHHQIDHRRWKESGWLKIEDGRFVADNMPDFQKQHPIVYNQIKADAPKWLPKTVFEPEPQRPML
jgi:hypothetical protein